MIIKWFKNILTERDNKTICAYRILAFIAGVEMLYKFLLVTNPQFGDFAGAMAALGITIAAKNWTEK